jgi:hypothetical protein
LWYSSAWSTPKSSARWWRGIVGDLRDSLAGQFQVVMEIHESRHVITPSGGVAGELRRTVGLASVVPAALERRWNSAGTPGQPALPEG